VESQEPLLDVCDLALCYHTLLLLLLLLGSFAFDAVYAYAGAVCQASASGVR
jgi:hypothetical protein